MQSLQRVLDTSTFIVILQELLDHKDIAVRTRALQILGLRLQNINEKSASAEEVNSKSITHFLCQINLS